MKAHSSNFYSSSDSSPNQLNNLPTSKYYNDLNRHQSNQYRYNQETNSNYQSPSSQSKTILPEATNQQKSSRKDPRFNSK